MTSADAPTANTAASSDQSAPAAAVNDREREQLYREFQPLVRKLIRQYSGSGELRQDLHGEIYCRFCALVDEYDPSRGIPLRPYLVRKLVTSIYTFARSQWRRGEREISLDAPELGIETVLPPVDPTPRWDFQLLSQDVLRALPDTIRALPPRQRQIVIWRYYESRSFEEIASSLGIQPATARSLLRHALNKLRRALAARGLLD